MNRALFPGLSLKADEAEMRATIARTDAAVFVLNRGDGRLAGYVEAGERSIADGCESSPVGYIEAWYVDPDVRRSGYGRSLLEAAEQWARDRGRSEMASDALIDNQVSHEAHSKSGYEEVDKVITYRKTLTSVSRPQNIRQAVPFFWVTDINRSVGFYTDGLGARLTNKWVYEDRLRWCWLRRYRTKARIVFPSAGALAWASRSTSSASMPSRTTRSSPREASRHRCHS